VQILDTYSNEIKEYIFADAESSEDLINVDGKNTTINFYLQSEPIPGFVANYSGIIGLRPYLNLPNE
jgi:hypothetical protein